MANKFTLFISIFIFLMHFNLLGQNNNKDSKSIYQSDYPLQISSIDSLLLSNLPEYNVKSGQLKTLLPEQINNSTQPYFMPIFEQVSLECGQQSGISYTFAYEWNYRNGTTADIPAHQLPTHFTFNFMNQGFGWTGVNYMHSWEIAKANGHPTVEDYGGMTAGGQSRWMSGYNEYYNGMSNKIDEVYQIKVGTPEGLLVLKNWIHNHLNDENVGGIASFYSDNPWNPTTLPAGTPEAGKHVIALFPYTAGHASTIVGYHDSIRYDYNQDGQYTNHLDINGDGKVDLKDWEIGGLLITEGYNGGVNWADSGFCYMMYRTLAEKDGEGGIWNNCVHVVEVKENYSPLLTMKVKIKHSRREQIRISASVFSPSNGIQTLNFPLFNFQGGQQYMQGGYEPEAIELELGLDITPLLGKVKSGETSDFSLVVDEHDPQGNGTGSVTSYSIMDYTNDILYETQYPQQNTPLNNNSQTSLPISATIYHDQLSIANENLATAYTGEFYETQLNANGGSSPYKWELLRHFSEEQSLQTFPDIDDEQLIFSDTIHAEAFKNIDFEFPFYGKKYDSIWIHTDGFIMFDAQDYAWPYLFDENLMIKTTNNISPLLNRYLYIDVSDNDGVWYEGNENYAAFRWKLSCKKTGQYNMSFALIIYPSGQIDYYYDAGNTFLFNYWSAGFGNGDKTNFKLAESINTEGTQSQKVEFIPANYPEELIISEDGLLSGLPLQDYFQIPLDFKLTDNNKVGVTKTLSFSSGIANVLENQKSENIFSVYPNPTNGKVYIDFELTEQTTLEISVSDLSGKKLSSKRYEETVMGKNIIQLNMQEIALEKQGIYFIQITGSGFAQEVSKLVYFYN